MVRLSLSSCLLAILLLVGSTSCSSSTVDWRICPTADPSGIFAPAEVDVNTTDVTPGSIVEFTLTGVLGETITNGMYQLRLTTNGNPHSDVDAAFATLDHILITPMPISHGAKVELAFNYTIPPADRFHTGDQEVQIELSMYSQELTPITCVQFTLPLKMPEPAKEEISKSKILGYCCALISVFFFGTNFLFVKAYDTNDGVFFQWCLCMGIWLCGLVVQFIRGSPFEPFAMIGGIMWAVGNACTVPIIGMIGLGVGMCLWGTSSLIMGWASGRFGFFGLHQQEISNSAMNYIGLIMCVASMGVMFTVKSVKEETIKSSSPKSSDVLEPLMAEDISITTAALMDDNQNQAIIGLRRKNVNGNDLNDSTSSMTPTVPSPSLIAESAVPTWTDRLPPGVSRLLGIGLSIFAGCLYGLSFSAAQYLIDSGTGPSSHGIDYVFSHFTGILTASTVYLISYCLYTRNHPWVSGDVILPGLASGMAWAIAQISWFVANDQIGTVGTFPLVSCGPGLVATLCAIIFYREIQGRTNYIKLLTAAVIIFGGVILIAFSLPASS